MLNAKRAFFVASLCLSVIVGCAANKSGDNSGLGAEPKPVTVSWDGSKVVCDPDPVHVLTHTQKVVWMSDSEIRIVLQTTPPEEVACKESSAHWKCTSRTFPTAGRIKYDASIKVNGAWQTADPIIDIGP
jgi:hypothetical protein